jgi:anti-anti-sigma factor
VLLELVALDAPVTLDLSGVGFLDSLGIATILAYARSRFGKEPMVLLNASPAVARIFEILHLGEHSGVRMRRSEDEPGAACLER